MNCRALKRRFGGDSSELRRYSHLVPVVLDCEDNQLPSGYD